MIFQMTKGPQNLEGRTLAMSLITPLCTHVAIATTTTLNLCSIEGRFNKPGEKASELIGFSFDAREASSSSSKRS